MTGDASAHPEPPSGAPADTAPTPRTARVQAPRVGPRISLITRTRRRPAFLARAARAIGTYSYPDIEWIVVNDGGPRLDVPRLGELSRKSGADLAIIDIPRTGGRSVAGNAGLERATGQYVLFHDDDDFQHPDAVAAMVEGLDGAHKSFIGAVCSCAVRHEVWTRGRLVRSTHGEIERPEHVPLLIDIANRNTLRTISTLVSRKVALEVGGLDESLDVLEDWDFWLKVLMSGDLVPAPAGMAYQSLRAHGEGVDANSARDDHLAREARLRNHYLREDLKSGRFGLGMLTNVADRETQDRMRAALRRAQKVFNPFGADPKMQKTKVHRSRAAKPKAAKALTSPPARSQPPLKSKPRPRSAAKADRAATERARSDRANDCASADASGPSGST